MIGVDLKLAAAVAAVAAVLLTVQTVRLSHSHTALALEQKDRAEERAAASKAAFETATAYRRIEADRQLNIQANANEATRLLNRAADDSRRAAAASVSLRSAFRAAGTCDRGPAVDPGPTGVGPAERSIEDLRAILFAELDERAGELALEADTLRIAGEQCAANWDALKKEKPLGG